MTRRHSIAFLALAAVAVVAASELVPRSDERISMLMRDGRVDDALAEIEHLRMQGASPASTEMHLYRAHMAAGRWREARTLLRSHLGRTPTDLGALQQLAEFDRSVGTETELLASLEGLAKIKPQRAVVQELLTLYRQTSRFGMAAELTLRLAGTSTVLPYDLDRAARYFTQHKRPSEAIAVLRHLKRTAKGLDAVHRHMLVEQLVFDGRIEAAVREAEDAVMQHRSVTDAVDFVSTLVDAQHTNAAVAVANVALRRIGRSGRQLVCAFAEAGQVAAAERVLATWGRGLLLRDRPEVDAFVEAARDCGSTAVLYATLIETLARIRTNQDLVLLRKVAAELGMTTLLPLRPILERRAVLDKAPLLGAELARLEHDAASIQRYALLAATVGVIAVEDADQWLALGIEANVADDMFLALRMRTGSGAAGAGERRTFALLAAHLGHWREHHSALRAGTP